VVQRCQLEIAPPSWPRIPGSDLSGFPDEDL